MYTRLKAVSVASPLATERRTASTMSEVVGDISALINGTTSDLLALVLAQIFYFGT